MTKNKSTVEAFDWKTGLVLFLGLLAGQIFIAIIAVLCIYVFHFDYEKSSGFMLFGYLASMITPIFFYELLILRPQSKRLNFNLKSMPFSVYLMIFPMMFGMMLISEYVVNFIPTTGPFFGDMYQKFLQQMQSLGMDNVSLILLTCVFAPILEEILFRGILQKSLVKKGLKPSYAILISSFIFGAVHGYPWQFVGAFLLGSVLGLVYHKTKSLLMPILLHVFNNLISAIMMIYLGTESLDSILHISSELSLILGLVVFGVSFYVFICRKAIIFDE